MKFILAMMLLFSVKSFAACPDVNGVNTPDVWIKSSTYWVFYYVTKMTDMDTPKNYEGTVVVTTKYGEEISRESKVTGVDDWYGDYHVQGKIAGFTFDSYTQEDGTAWVDINDRKSVIDPIEVEVAKFHPIVCP